MTNKKRLNRQTIIASLQSRGPLTPEERPIVIVGPEEELTPEEAAKYDNSWVPHSGQELCSAALDTFHRTLNGTLPPPTRYLLGELSYKFQAAEYHLRRVGGDDLRQWFEAEAFMNQARSTLEIVARILHRYVRQAPDSFHSNGTPIANALRNQPTTCPQHVTSVHFAGWIEEAKFPATLSAVRDEIAHRQGFRSLAKATAGVVHLGGMDLDQFCIGMWFSLMTFTQEFLEWTVTIAREMQSGRSIAALTELVAPPNQQRGAPRYQRRVIARPPTPATGIQPEE